MGNNIELYLISGFLGSGKTTFLQKMLENFKGKKVGVIINEFGNIGIDGQLIEKDGINLVEINNGSIFCSCLKGDFVHTLVQLSKEPIDILLIENSGMADPANIHNILDELRDKVKRQYDYKGAVCLVDSRSFLKHIKVLTPIQNQIASSNFIIINKIDLVNQSTLIDIQEKIKEINPSTHIFETIYSQVPLYVLQKSLYDNGYIGETSNKPWNRPPNYSIESDKGFTYEEIFDFVKEICKYTYRIKGFIKGDSVWWQVDGVEDSVEILEFKLDKKDIINRTKLVMIGKDSTNFKDIILKSWEEKFQEVPIIYDKKGLCS